MANNPDLTRWNRAGLNRIRYIDGNAATYLEDVRLNLAKEFPAWSAMQVTIPEDESKTDKLERIERQYDSQSDDILWNISRSFVRSAHILTETMDAYANESKLATASQWESVRKMITMLDYHPQPPASAYTPLVIQAKADVSGTLEAGFQVKYSPVDGSAPVVFETLSDLDISPQLNEIHPLAYDLNQHTLSGRTLTLNESIDDLVIGEPLVLKSESGLIKAHIIEGITVDDEQTTVRVTPALSNLFKKGETWVHLAAKERLAPLQPATTGAQVGKILYLADQTDLSAGEVVLIATPGKKPYYRRLKSLDGTKLTFYSTVGDLNLSTATVSRPVTVSVSYQGQRSPGEDGTVLQTLYIAGDWSYLIDLWVADKRVLEGDTYLPVYHVISANYRPVGSEEDEEDKSLQQGYTALTLSWHHNTDGVAGEKDLSLDNPQSILVPANTQGTWTCDTFLQKSNDGHLADTLTCSAPKKTTAGDLAVLVQGSQTAWCELAAVSVDMDAQTADLEAANDWQDRGGGPFYLGRSTVYSHFNKQVRLVDWQVNETDISGDEIPLAEIPEGLSKSRVVVVEYGENLVYKTTVSEVNTDSVTVTLNDELPATVDIADVVIYANVVNAGHGVSRNTRVLGSGDATKRNQSFIFAFDDIAFEADSELSAGVRAAIEVQVDGVIWQQVSSLKDSQASDNHYSVRMTEQQYLKIGFGDGHYGRRLPSGTNNIRISYRQGVGSTANLAVGSLVKLVKPHYLVDSVAQPLSASGGADMEGLDSLKTNAPAALLTLQRCVSLRDFSLLTKSQTLYAQAQAFSLPTGLGQRENIEVVVVPAGGSAFTEQMRTDLQDYLLTHALPGVSVKASAYEPVIVYFSVAIRVDHDAYDSEVVAAAVETALQSAFSVENRQLGQDLYRGEIYQVVEAVEGVQNSTCEMSIDAEAETLVKVARGDNGVIRVIFPSDRQCIHLNEAEPGITVTPQEYKL